MRLKKKLRLKFREKDVQGSTFDIDLDQIDEIDEINVARNERIYIDKKNKYGRIDKIYEFGGE